MFTISGKADRQTDWHGKWKRIGSFVGVLSLDFGITKDVPGFAVENGMANER